MSMEDQFDVAAQDRRAEAAKRARVPAYVYDRAAVIAESQGMLTRRDAQQALIEAEATGLPEQDPEAAVEVPEVPGKVDQEPELPKGEGHGGAVVEPCCGTLEPHAHQGGEPAAGG